LSSPRFYCSSPLVAGERIRLPADVFHHAIRVRRLRAGSELVLFGGNGSEALARLLAVGRDMAEAEIIAVAAVDRESPLAITLLQGISAGDRMDYTLQKAVELGIDAIVPVVAERSIVRLSAERAEKRIAHWQQVVISACEQCGRNVIPSVAPAVPLADALAKHPSATATRYVLSVADGKRLRELPVPTGPIALLAGPEGGLTDAEEASSVSAGFVRLSLGPRVLRTETAAVAALAAMQAMWGNG